MVIVWYFSLNRFIPISLMKRDNKKTSSTTTTIKFDYFYFVAAKLLFKNHSILPKHLSHTTITYDPIEISIENRKIAKQR